MTGDLCKECTGQNTSHETNHRKEFINMLNHQNKQEHPTGVPHILSYENTDRLKHEVAFHNPNHLNPNEMLNEILERYFKLVDEVRK